MNVYFLRHGEAGKRVAVPSKDLERSLTASGKDELTKIARSIRRLDIKFDKIVASPLPRAQESAEIDAKLQKKSGKVELWDELKPEGNRSDLFQRLAKLRQDSEILLVGHEPYFSTTIGDLISGNSSAHIVLKKGGLARVEVTSFNPKPAGELRWLLSPRLLKNQ